MTLAQMKDFCKTIPSNNKSKTNEFLVTQCYVIKTRKTVAYFFVYAESKFSCGAVCVASRKLTKSLKELINKNYNPACAENLFFNKNDTPTFH